MKVLSLFAGMGGFDLGFEMAGFDVVAQVEIEPYCKQVLKYNFPTAKQYGDIREVAGEQILRDCGAIDVICGGFPCQDISSAGKGAGLDGERSGLWWEMHRLIGELKPTWVVAENVAALRTRGLDRVKSSMEEMGYQVECLGIRASSIGATHQRKRLWIVANCNSVGRKLERKRRVSGKTGAQQGHNVDGCSAEKPVGHSESERQGEPNNKANAGATGGQARGIPGGTGSLVNPNSDGAQEGDIARNDQPEIPTACDTSSMAHADSNGVWEQSGWRNRTDWSTYSPFNFPVGPGQQQYDWEQPRTAQFSLGTFPYGLSEHMVKRGLAYAANTNKNIKSMPQLLQEFFTEPLQCSPRGLYAIQQEKILLANLLGIVQQQENRARGRLLQAKESRLSRQMLRFLSEHQQASCPSYRSELQEQFTKQLANSLQQLPRPLALASKKAWNKYRRSVSKERKLALSAIGNSIVPAIAYSIARTIGRMERHN